MDNIIKEHTKKCELIYMTELENGGDRMRDFLKNLEIDLNIKQQTEFVSEGEVLQRLGYFDDGHIPAYLQERGWYKNRFISRNQYVYEILRESNN